MRRMPASAASTGLMALCTVLMRLEGAQLEAGLGLYVSVNIINRDLNWHIQVNHSQSPELSAFEIEKYRFLR